jgi:shikimate 5-dehydrogenase
MEINAVNNLMFREVGSFLADNIDGVALMD